jgi:GNAT superfamily N-acetyltransferase
MGFDFAIRPATQADEVALGRYGGALMRLHHELDRQRFIMVDHPEQGYGRFLVSQLGDRESLVLVAEREGEVVGYVFAGLEPTSWKDLRAPCGFIHDVFVEADARRAGVATQLVQAAIEWVHAQGMPRVVLTSAAKNLGAQRLFESLGFRHTMVELTREIEPGESPEPTP